MLAGIGACVDDDVVDGNLKTLEQLLDHRVASGYDGVELGVGVCNGIRCGRLVPSELERLKRLLSRYPLRYTLHGPCELSLLRNPELAARVLESCLTYAAYIGAEVVVYHSAQIALHEPSIGLAPLPSVAELEEMWRRETEVLGHFARRAEELGVVLAVENRDPHLWEVATLARSNHPASDLLTYHQGMSLSRLRTQVQQIGSDKVGICLDVGHAFLAAPYWESPDYLAAVQDCAPWVKHVHFHDNFGQIDDRSVTFCDRLIFGEADNHMPPGWGCIPLRQTLQALMAAGYAGWIVLELRPRYEEYHQEALAYVHGLLDIGR